jgi:DDE superfamily endonuclease
LILDGHNSHLTYEFCKFVEEHRIVVICLPSHTTHALQPCDVGVFGPLDSAWKAEVVKTSQQYLAITKYNLLEHYDSARKRALKPSTIISAFAKTGIWPFNRLALDPQLFEPSKNTTTQSSQPLPANLPQLLIPIPNIRLQSDDPTSNLARIQHYKIPVPDPLHHTASRKDLRNENAELRNLLNAAGIQLERDFAQLKLMDGENERLRKVAFAKEEKRMRKKELTTVHPRHMTGTEMLHILAQNDWKKKMKDVHQEAATIFHGLRTAIDQHYKDLDDQAKAAEKEQKRQKVAAQRAEKAALVASEKARKAAEREAKRLENAAGRAKGRQRGRGRAVPVRGGSGHRRKARIERNGTESGYDSEEGADTEESLQDNIGEKNDADRLIVAEDVVSVRGETLEMHEGIERPRPRPRPRPRYRTVPSIEEDSSGNEQRALLHIRSRRRGPAITVNDNYGQNETQGRTEDVDLHIQVAGHSNLRRSARQQK